MSAGLGVHVTVSGALPLDDFRCSESLIELFFFFNSLLLHLQLKIPIFICVYIFPVEHKILKKLCKNGWPGSNMCTQRLDGNQPPYGKGDNR